MRRTHRGSALLVVLILLTVLLLGGLSLARSTETSTLLSGNLAFKDSALEASEVGVSEAFAALKALASDDANSGNWYYALKLADDANGLPTGVDWTKTPQVTVGANQVSYVVDRLCQGVLPVADPNAQCVVKQIAATGSAKVGAEAFVAPTAKEYRVTVSVTGPKRTTSLVQVLVVR